RPGTEFGDIRGEGALTVHRVHGEQSNSSVVYGDRLVMKILRHYQSGPNPEYEMAKYLTDRLHFENIPAFAGSLEYSAEGSEPGVLAILQAWVRNEGDAWQWTMEEMERYYESCAPIPFPENALNGHTDVFTLSERAPSQLARDHVGIYLDSAAT